MPAAKFARWCPRGLSMGLQPFRSLLDKLLRGLLTLCMYILTPWLPAGSSCRSSSLHGRA